MKNLIRLLTFWIPIKKWRKKAREVLYNFSVSFIPLKNSWVIFYDTFSKNGNGDSIRPIAEELRRRRPDFKFFFVSKEMRPIDMADEVLVIGSHRYEYVLERAKYLVSPMDLPSSKRKGQIWIMTWHGNPIKGIYLYRDKSPEMYKQMERFAPIDYFCISSEFGKKIYMEMFNLPANKFIKSGLPRNDILFSDEIQKQSVRRKVEKILNISPKDKIIFYCPTWRSANYKMPFMLDVKLLQQKLGNKYKFLIRSHVGKHDWVDSHGDKIQLNEEMIIDVGNYPNISELYLASDIFVIDYSSAIFDMSILRKPLISFIFDYKDYAENTGFCLNYFDEIPSLVAYTTEDLITAIKHCEKDDVANTEKYNKFIEKHNTYECGKAAQYIVDIMLNEGEEKNGN